jgi:DDE superfamily endonuclease
MAAMPVGAGPLGAWLEPFAAALGRQTWRRAVVLAAGALLSPGRRTVTSALRAAGLGNAPGFANYHRVLSEGRWSGPALAERLLALLVAAFAPHGPVVVALDDTLERRWGRRIRARGIYRDPVRSSRGHFVKASGLRWLSLMLAVPVPWAGRAWALPFLTVLAPSERSARERSARERGGRHKRLTDWARQMLLQAARWLPGRRIVAVADSSFAALELLAAVRRRVVVVTRLRLDARLFAPPPPRTPRTVGRPRLVGERLPTLERRLCDRRTRWRRLVVAGWYGGGDRVVEACSGTALWHHPGKPVVPLRWVLVRDPRGEFRPQAFLCTDLHAGPGDILSWFVRRWATEVTFAEARRHLGVETQRQWSDRAVARTTPALLGLYALVALWAGELHRGSAILPRASAWYAKRAATFSDALAAVRRAIWADAALRASRIDGEAEKVPRAVLDRLTDLACYAA